jgi:hypothetical protein
MIAKLLPALLLLAAAPLPAAPPVAVAVPPVPNFSPGPEYADNVRMFQGIPGIERAANGRLWATWYGGGTGEDRFNYIMLVTSNDDGKTWSSLKLVLDPDRDGPVRAFDPCLWHDPAGKLWLFWAQRGGSEMPQLFAMSTTDSGSPDPKWTEPRRIADGIMMNKPTALKDGTWLLPTALWKREGSSRVERSTDQGATWEFIGSATIPKADDRNCDENMIVQRQDGGLWMLVRTRYGIGETTSTDGGKTWSEVTPSQIPHAASRFFIRRLASGKLLLVRHNSPNTKARSHLTAYLSDDDGHTWKGGLLLDERLGVSYPDGVQDKDGVIRVIYDFNRQQEKQIFMAAFNESDIEQGKPSASTRLRVVVNQAIGTAPPKADKPAAKATEIPKLSPTDTPPGAVPPLVVSTDPAYDQYVSRLYVMSTVLPNGRICYVAYGNKGVLPGTDGAAPPNYLTFYYSDDKGATLHIGFFLVPPPEPAPPGAMVDPRIGQTADGDAIVFFPTVHGGRSPKGWYSLWACVVRNSQAGKRGTFEVGPRSYICRGTAGTPTVVGSDILMPSFVSLPAGKPISHDYDGVRLWRLHVGKEDAIYPELLSQLPNLPNLDDNSGFCDPFIVGLGGRNYRMLIRAMSGPYWCDSQDKGKSWGVPYQPKDIPKLKNVIDGMATDHEGDVVVAYNPTRGRMQAALAVYRKDGTVAKLTFDPRDPPVGTHMANFVISIDRNHDGSPTGNYIVTYDHGRNMKAAGLEADGVNYRGAICTAIVPKVSVLAGTLDGVVIHDVPTHPQAK